MKQLDSKAVWLFFLSLLPRMFFFIIMVIMFIGPVFLIKDTDFTNPNTVDSLEPNDVSMFSGFGDDFIMYLVLMIIFSFIWAKLTYMFYKYELTDLGFKKESGVITKKYVTVPYDRIQNVDINRGLLSRILGLSDLQIQTAGSSAMVTRYSIWGMGAEGRLPGLSKQIAEELRDELIKRAKNSRSQGL